MAFKEFARDPNKPSGLAEKLKGEVPSLFPTISLVDQELRYHSMSQKTQDSYPPRSKCRAILADLIADIKEVVEVSNKFSLKYFSRIFFSKDPPSKSAEFYCFFKNRAF